MWCVPLLHSLMLSKLDQPQHVSLYEQVQCRGDEMTINDCPSKKWDGDQALTCARNRRAAGVVCGKCKFVDKQLWRK